ncbi:MAG: Ku protein [Rhodobacterales bacterium]|nr:Ku protein [Rhodobacterales bacterium]
MARRALWKGQLRLSLVSIPVELYAAHDSSSRVSFRQIHKPSGKRIHYDKSVTGVGPVKSEDIVKGYEVDGGYILLDPKEIDAIKLETKKTVELVQFVGACEIPPLYFDKPYYLVPTDDLAEDAYRVVRDALRASEKIGLGQMTMRGKEYLVAIKPCGDGLLLETLFYADEIHESEPMFNEIKDAKADEELLDLATALIEKRTAPFDAQNFTDHFAKALTELIEAKKKNRKTPRVAADEEDRPGGENVVDLMAALKKSLGSDGPKKKGSGKSGSAATSKKRKKAS